MFQHHRIDSFCSLGGTFVLLLSLFCAQVQGEEVKLERYEFVQIRMGVAVRITLFATSQNDATNASEAAYARIKELDSCLSDYDPDSELNQLCRGPSGVPVSVSDDLWRMLSESQHYSSQSDGAFDATIGPIVKLWRTARRRKELPNPQELQSALEKVGNQNVHLDAETKTVTLLQSGMQLDFGGIGKGFAADEALAVLQKHGITRAMVAVSGEIRVGDPPPGKEFWRVAIEERDTVGAKNREPLILNAVRTAISTSGDAYQFLEIGGVRYSHIVDPQTGVGLKTPASVTIVAPTGLQADVLATIASVLGPAEGIQFLTHHYPEVQAHIVRLNDDRSVEKLETAGWSKLVSTSESP